LEGRTGPAHGDGFLFSALVGDRRRTGEHLQFGGARKAAAVLAEEHGQAWGKASAGTRQAGKNPIAVEDWDKTLDALLVRGDAAREGGDVLQEALDAQSLRLDHALIAR